MKGAPVCPFARLARLPVCRGEAPKLLAIMYLVLAANNILS